MKLDSQLGDGAFLAEIGHRLERERLERNLTQAQLATQAGVSLSTVARIESGEPGTRLSGFLRLCRALEILDRFEMVLPEPQISPMDQSRFHGKARRRARPTRNNNESPRPWTWGDES
jgi:transcriptional regulator with XRE-family HTH domain